jgi:signal transduction histidine kinase
MSGKPSPTSSPWRAPSTRSRLLFGALGDGEEERLQRALRAERLRVCRELHDGALQSLAGAALQLEALERGLDPESRGIRKRLHEIQQMVLEEERELRHWLEALRESGLDPRERHKEPAAHIARLCRRVQRQWGLPVRLSISGAVLPSMLLADHVYRIVQEGLTNIVKHARATAAHVERHLLDDRVRIVIRDNGRGFPFRGRYSLAELDVLHLGPHSIKERTASLNGQLVVTSTHAGACVEVELPLALRALASDEAQAKRDSR